MKFNHILKCIICILCVVAFLLLSGCDGLYQTIEKQINGYNRPDEALLMPDFTGDITDIRISFKERDINAVFNDRYENAVFVQLYYGYCSDGQ